MESSNDESSAVITLEDCLQSFINWENLDNKELFNCKRCKKSQPADKKLDIWKLPPCLVRSSSIFEFFFFHTVRCLDLSYQTFSIVEQSLDKIFSIRSFSNSFISSSEVSCPTFNNNKLSSNISKRR